jgi:hypothetical protein
MTDKKLARVLKLHDCWLRGNTNGKFRCEKCELMELLK